MHGGQQAQGEGPRQVGRYRVLRHLGRGGMAVVHLAHDDVLGRDVALKQISSEYEHDPLWTHRFLHESRIVGQLKHQNVVTVFDFFEHDGAAFIAMEYLERGSLRPLVRRLSVPESAAVLQDVFAGLAHAERRGIVHRDLKPENLLVGEEGTVKIADFGMAKAAAALPTAYRTAVGQTVGTPLYMAPEQASGQADAIGPWTDVYAVGCIAYELLTGAAPFASVPEPLAQMYHHVHMPVTPAWTVNENVDRELSDWLDGLLVKDPAQRVQHADTAWDTLEELVIARHGARWRRSVRLPEVPADEPVEGPPSPLRRSRYIDPAAIDEAGSQYVTRVPKPQPRPSVHESESLIEEMLREHGAPGPEPSAPAPAAPSNPAAPAAAAAPGPAAPSSPATPAPLDVAADSPAPAAPSVPAPPAATPDVPVRAALSDLGAPADPAATFPPRRPAPDAAPGAAPPTKPEGRGPRVLALALIPALVGVVVLGFALLGGGDEAGAGDDGDRPEEIAAPPPPSTLVSGPISVRLPAGWEHRDGAALGLEDAVASGPAGDGGGTVTIGVAQADGPSLLPDGLATTPTTAPVVETLAGGLRAYRYDGVDLGAGERASIYAVPTDRGNALVACRQPAPADAAFATACAEVARTLAIRDARVYPAGPIPEYEAAVADTVRAADRSLRDAGTALRRAKTPASQARAAQTAGKALARAAKPLDGLDVSPPDRAAHAELITALDALAGSHDSLAAAARGSNRARYSRARTAIRRARTAAATALTGLGEAGYRLPALRTPAVPDLRRKPRPKPTPAPTPAPTAVPRPAPTAVPRPAPTSVPVPPRPTAVPEFGDPIRVRPSG